MNDILYTESHKKEEIFTQQCVILYIQRVMGRDYCSPKVKMMMQGPDRRTLLVAFKRTCWLSPAFG